MDNNTVDFKAPRPIAHVAPCNNCGYRYLQAPASPLIAIRQPRTRKGKGKAVGYVCARCIQQARASQMMAEQPQAKPRRGRPRKTA